MRYNKILQYQISLQKLTRSIIMVNIVPSSISYCTSVRVQYDTLRGTIFTNIHAITLLLYSSKYFFFRSVINTVKIWFFHISLLCCTRKNILIFALVQYEFCFSWNILTFCMQNHLILTYFTHFDTTHF